MATQKKVAIIGLDSAAPGLIFDQWAADLPNLTLLRQQGIYGELESCDPPITVPAWMTMMTSKDPGQLGVYGFRNRKDYSYDGLYFANSRSIREDTVWDILSRLGRKVILVGIPQTYPPKVINGQMITCFLTPSTKSQYTYPPELRQEVEDLVGEYILDADNFRTEDKEDLLRRIHEMTRRRFKVAKYLLKNKEWDFFMMVEMGVDRIHHGFWKYFDKGHRKYEPGNPFENAIKEYYRYIDQEVGEILSLLDRDTITLVVSDHGAKRMEGGICVNEWLIQEGYLKLRSYPNEVIPFSKAEVDWQHTKVWSEGGYYARVFMNVKGREPQGAIDPRDYEKTRDELIAKLEAITDENGKNIGTRVFRPEQLYIQCNNVPPDLIVYFGNLDWRSVGSIGLKTIHTFENDTGPDDANHAKYGTFILRDPQKRIGKRVDGLQIMDIAPTVLNLMGLEVPRDMRGKVISY